MTEEPTGGDTGDAIRVVLVDDHQMFVDSLVKLLGGVPGIRIVGTAASGHGALAAVRDHRPDVLLLDHQLPDALGTDVAAEIVAAYPATRVIMLTAVADGDVVAAAIAAGCSGYVTKHRPVDEVVTAVRLAHQGELAIPPSDLALLRPRVAPETPGVESKVSARELDVLRLMAEGLSTTAMAERLFVSSHTVRNHVQHILAKFDAHSKLEAVAIAVRSGLIYYD